MTSDKIIKLIQDNGLTLHGDIEHFAALVRNDGFNKHNHLWLTRINEAVEAEREEIASEFEKLHESVKHLNNYWLHAANYVRERGRV